MKILKNIDVLKKAINDISNLGFVPTMGGLHDGHKSLIRESQKKCKKTLVSIYINPKQFNNKKDFKSYPRKFDTDLRTLKKMNVDYVFLPLTNEIYKKKIKQTKIPNKYKVLCAKFRKGHFEGVLNVMKRFLSIIKPKCLFMGEKDYQQLFLIKLLLINNSKTKLYSCKTIRDKNFVALSSRNFLLSNKNLKKAGIIAKNLINFKKNMGRSNINNKYIFQKKNELNNKFNIKIEYLEARNPENLNIYYKAKKFKLFIAYYIDGIRLIDNF